MERLLQKFHQESKPKEFGFVGWLWLSPRHSMYQRIILVLVIGGRDSIASKRRQGLYLVYKWYFSCQLGEYMLPTTFFKNLKNPLNV